MAVCNKDCFRCPYPDCVCDALDADDYAEAREREELLRPKTARQKALAAYKKAYYEANREQLVAKQKAYREANREEIAAYKKAYYEANHEALAAYQKAYHEANREDGANRADADRLRVWRKAHGYTQKALGALCGLSQQAISLAELAMTPLPEPVRAMMGGTEIGN